MTEFTANVNEIRGDFVGKCGIYISVFAVPENPSDSRNSRFINRFSLYIDH